MLTSVKNNKKAILNWYHTKIHQYPVIHFQEFVIIYRYLQQTPNHLNFGQPFTTFSLDTDWKTPTLFKYVLQTELLFFWLNKMDYPFWIFTKKNWIYIIISVANSNEDFMALGNTRRRDGTTEVR